LKGVRIQTGCSPAASPGKHYLFNTCSLWRPRQCHEFTEDPSKALRQLPFSRASNAGNHHDSFCKARYREGDKACHVPSCTNGATSRRLLRVRSTVGGVRPTKVWRTSHPRRLSGSQDVWSPRKKIWAQVAGCWHRCFCLMRLIAEIFGVHGRSSLTGAGTTRVPPSQQSSRHGAHAQRGGYSVVKQLGLRLQEVS
jgi:hypothetical protein